MSYKLSMIVVRIQESSQGLVSCLSTNRTGN